MSWAKLINMRLVPLLFLAILLPTAAAAQNSGIFIQAGPLLDVLQESTFDGSPTLTASLSFGPIGAGLVGGPPSDEQTRSTRERVAPGGAFALGVFVTPSVSLRVETSFHGQHVSSDETSSASEGTSVLQRRLSSATDFSVAAGWHQGTGRTTISYLAGIVFRREKDESFARFTYPSVVVRSVGGRFVQVVETETTEGSYNATVYDRGVMAGIDVTVNLSDHFAIVPQVRLVGASYSWNVRPGIMMRWRR